MGHSGPHSARLSISEPRRQWDCMFTFISAPFQVTRHRRCAAAAQSAGDPPTINPTRSCSCFAGHVHTQNKNSHPIWLVHQSRRRSNTACSALWAQPASQQLERLRDVPNQASLPLPDMASSQQGVCAAVSAHKLQVPRQRMQKKGMKGFGIVHWAANRGPEMQ